MAEEKKPKDLVNYGPGDVDGQHCGNCTSFVEPHYCEKVSGRIRSGAWCRLWMPKGGKKENDDAASAA